MTDPKLLLILKEIEARLEVINGVSPYFSNIGQDVIRGKRRWNPDDLPACSVFLSPRELDERTGARSALAAAVNIEARMKITPFQLAEDWAVYMLADIQRAVETTNTDLDGLLLKTIAWDRDLISYPENDVSEIAVQVTYSIPHIRRYGDPS